MANDWLNHKELKIIRGMYAVLGQTSTYERPLVTCNLMSSGSTGITLKSDGWSPAMPQMKNNGVWADSPINNGRQLISGVDSNVTESIQLIITGSTFQEAVGFLSQLRQMQQDARDFWQGQAQFDPVYLAWWAVCGAGSQYALIYNMDMKFEYLASPVPTIGVTLSVERECYWRAIPPGANPKQWTYASRGQSASFIAPTAVEISSLTNDDLVVTGTLQNKSEFGASFISLVSSNFITIPASSIPGDAPALVEFVDNPLAAARYNFVMGKKTVKISNPSMTSDATQNAIFTATDGKLGVDATRVNDTGAVKPAGGATAQRVEVSFATATNQLRWNAASGSSPTPSINRFLGRWNVFLRCRQNGGALGNIVMYLRYGGYTIASDTDGEKLNVVYPPLIAGAGNSTVWGLVYMGTIDFPSTPGKAITTSLGSYSPGLTMPNSFDIALFASRPVAAGVLYVADLIFIPVDEGSICYEIISTVAGGPVLYDETGYFTHGSNELLVTDGTPDNVLLAKPQGPGIQLTPNVENRLYYVFYDGSLQSAVTDTVNFHLNIVPRWVGIRGR